MCEAETARDFLGSWVLITGSDDITESMVNTRGVSKEKEGLLPKEGGKGYNSRILPKLKSGLKNI